MPMKITRLTTHWDPGEAHTIVEFLDRLRDELWETYGDEIITLLQQAAVSHQLDEHQTKLPFDDDIEF
jgi:hypothetical protein